MSHPVGTTVRVLDYLKNVPVRRQTALKTTSRTITKVRKTLEAYALARPSVKLSLRILKAKSNKGDWIYAPRTESSIADAAVKVFGKKTTDHCHWITWNSSSASKVGLEGARSETTELSKADAVLDLHAGGIPASDCFCIQAFIPKSNCGKLSDSFSEYSCYTHIVMKIFRLSTTLVNILLLIRDPCLVFVEL